MKRKVLVTGASRGIGLAIAQKLAAECFLRNLYAGQEAIVRTGHGTTDWFQIGKGVRQDCILSRFIRKKDYSYFRFI